MWWPLVLLAIGGALFINSNVREFKKSEQARSDIAELRTRVERLEKHQPPASPALTKEEA